MTKRIGLPSSVVLSVLFVGLLAGASGLVYAPWGAEPSLRMLPAAAWAAALVLLLAWLGTKRAGLTQRQRAHADVTRSEAYYQTLWNYAVDAMLILDAEGLVRDVNRRAEVKLGCRRETLLGRPAADLFAEPDRARFEALLQQVLVSGREGTSAEMRVPVAQGGGLRMDLDMVPIRQREGGSGLLLQFSDVTEKAQLAEQLLRSERLASLSQFSSMFAHDIRNPLAGMKKTLELLGRRGGVQDETAIRLLDDLQFTTDLLLGMINDMLDVYQDSYSGLPLACSTFSARGLLDDVARLFTAEAESKGVRLCVEVPEEDVPVMGDRRRLQRVAINLVHNALKYAPGRSVVTLSAGRLEPDRLVLRVEDEGPGVDPSELPHLFELFFRKKDGRDPRIGRGLGLHFCRLVAEAHGGRIWVDNRPTGGARFSVALPAAVSMRTEGPACRSRS